MYWGYYYGTICPLRTGFRCQVLPWLLIAQALLPEGAPQKWWQPSSAWLSLLGEPNSEMDEQAGNWAAVAVLPAGGGGNKAARST